jgi:hypothetical protein
MAPPASLQKMLRTYRVLWAALTLSQALFLVVLFVVRDSNGVPAHPPPSSTVLMMYIVSASITVFSFVLPSRMYAQSARLRPLEIVRSDMGAGRFADPVKAAQQASATGFTAFMLRMALAEAVSLDGFALGFLGTPLVTFVPFFAVGIALALLRFPTVESVYGPFERAHGASFSSD